MKLSTIALFSVCVYLYDRIKFFIMKLLCLLLSCIFFVSASAQKTDSAAAPNPAKKLLIVDASCGQCKFGLKGKGCSLAVRINDQAYFVDGTAIDDHGDAHADDGFCNKVRKAQVQGDVVEGRFKASYFKLLPEAVKKSN